jgi:rubrerythrin
MDKRENKALFKELLRSQQGELNAVLMYQRLAQVVKTDKERETFL